MLALGLLAGAETRAAGVFELSGVRALGVEARMGQEPYATLLAGGDGALYGTCLSGSGGKGLVFRLDRTGTEYTVLHAFTGTTGDGAVPFAGLVEAGDGLLYGTTRDGGASGLGAVYRLRKDGTEFRVLHSFAGAPGDGASPYAGLLEGRDGFLYGTTHFGGVSNQGTVFRLDKGGGDYRVLREFTGANGDGSQPTARLCEGSDGRLYGTTYFGGGTNRGTVFALGRNGGGFAVLHGFGLVAGDGGAPYAGVIQGGDGGLYGTTVEGSTNGVGTVYRLNPDGSDYRLLHRFTLVNGGGIQPYSELFEDSEGQLYGTTPNGGSLGGGTVYRLGRDGSGFSVIHSFAGATAAGSQPFGGVCLGRDGALYGATSAGGLEDVGALYKVNRDGTGARLLWSFSPAGGDGSELYGELSRGTNGLLYGTTWSGGPGGRGILFSVGPGGDDFRTLHGFGGKDGDGASPYSGVFPGQDGLLYGTTVNGGGTNLGVVYAVGTDGSGYRTLHSFTRKGGDGANPFAGVIEGTDRVLYGATASGGNSDKGSVYALTRDGATYRVLHHFTGGSGDGATPYGRLIEGSDGLLYGTTAYGGGSDQGAVYRVGKGGESYRVLRIFTGLGGDGARPYAPLLEAGDGLLYGTTHFGGNTNRGTVFRLRRDGSDYAVLHSFGTGDGDGLQPSGGLVEGADGALYGTTYFGGSTQAGAIFRLTRDGTSYRVVASFSTSDGKGANPFAGLLRGADGALYGTTVGGGKGPGAVFRVAPSAVLSLGAAGALALEAPAGHRFAIEARGESTGTAAWEPLAQVTSGDGPTPFTDPAFAQQPARFYRAVLKP